MSSDELASEQYMFVNIEAYCLDISQRDIFLPMQDLSHLRLKFENILPTVSNHSWKYEPHIVFR